MKSTTSPGGSQKGLVRGMNVLRVSRGQSNEGLMFARVSAAPHGSLLGMP